MELKTYVYTGVGSRIVPSAIEAEKGISKVAKLLSFLKFTLRSGGAAGVDSLFEKYHKSDNKEIYLPYKNYQKNKSDLYKVNPDAYDLVRIHHPLGDKISKESMVYLARNCMQVLGFNLDKPSDFLLTWREESSYGGTAFTVNLAKHYNVPVYNLFTMTEQDIETFIGDLLKAYYCLPNE